MEAVVASVNTAVLAPLPPLPMSAPWNKRGLEGEVEGEEQWW